MVHQIAYFYPLFIHFFSSVDLSQSSTKSFRFQNMKQDFLFVLARKCELFRKFFYLKLSISELFSNFYGRNHIKVTLYHAILNSLQVSLVFFRNSFRSLFSHPHRRSLMFLLLAAFSTIYRHRLLMSLDSLL